MAKRTKIGIGDRGNVAKIDDGAFRERGVFIRRELFA